MTIFKPRYLYIKQHSLTGKLYFGQTSKKDPIKYMGSGKHWKAHIRKYGTEHVVTLWYELFDNESELTDFATKFSKEMKIVESDSWLNLIPENGLSGSCVGEYNHNFGKPLPESTRSKISAANSGKKRTDNQRNRIRSARTGTTHSVDTKRRISESQIGVVREALSEEHKNKIAEGNRGKTLSEETKTKMSASKRGVSLGNQRIVECPHCKKTGGISNMTRHHFNNCKAKV